MQQIDHLISLASALLVLFLAGSAFFLTFESLKDLVVKIGVLEQIAWLWSSVSIGGRGAVSCPDFRPVSILEMLFLTVPAATASCSCDQPLMFLSLLIFSPPHVPNENIVIARFSKTYVLHTLK